jgi:cell fate regulator YaaT (PSP1 superfamily)
MRVVIGVRFNTASKVYYFDPTGVENVTVGDYVVVETARGEEIGRVVIPPSEVSDQAVVGQLKSVQRQATALDLTQMTYYRCREQEALARCEEKVLEHGLVMKAVRAEYNYDGSRLVFFFTAENRVDFRHLVQDLARTFQARIELRQIGVRDEAKMMGGIGKCGLHLCCATWLTEFNPVSIKMAKHQDLPLSPMEISGVCGRLLCCLAYEDDQYIQMQAELPKRGATVQTAHGPGKVVQTNIIKGTLHVELENEAVVEVVYEGAAAPPTAAPAEPDHRRARRRRQPKA